MFVEKSLKHLVTNGSYEEFQSFIAQHANPSANEIVAMAEVLLEMCEKISLPQNAIDICGTGGDTTIKTTNISSIVALKLAQNGVKVVKHAGRAVSSSSGAADFASNLPTHNLPPQECLTKHNYCFLPAGNYHKAYHYLAPFRKAYGKPTVFNMLGPIINPAKPKFRMVGTSFSNLEEYAKAFDLLGFHGIVVQSQSGCDELLSFEQNHIIEFGGGKIHRHIFNPQSHNIPPIIDSSIQGKTPQENYQNAMSYFANPQKNTLFYTVAINYALARKVYNSTFNVEEFLKTII